VLRDVCRGAVVAFDIADMADAEVFTGELISAVGEAFNNVVLHAYRGDSSVVVELEVMYDDSGVHAALRDYGPSFDPTRGAATSSFAGADFADNDSLPESGMGLFIMRSFLDEMRYSARQAPGEANVLRMHKRIPGSEGRSSSAVRPRSA
jgi:serine/threonine-protein kinase RsbW